MSNKDEDSVALKKQAAVDFNKDLDEDDDFSEQRIQFAYKISQPYVSSDWTNPKPLKFAKNRANPNSRIHERLKKEPKDNPGKVEEILRTNKAGDPRHSNYNSSKSLKDIEAIFCRMNKYKFTCKELAARFHVSERCISRCLRGFTYKHLNKRYPPWY